MSPMQQEKSSWSAGVTLPEVLAVVTLLAISATLAIPRMQRYEERGYWVTATDLLTAIYENELRYADLNNGRYQFPLLPGSGMAAWRTIFVDDPNIGGVALRFAVLDPNTDRAKFDIGPNPAVGFRAVAVRSETERNTWMWIDANGYWCGGSTIDFCTEWPWP